MEATNRRLGKTTGKAFGCGSCAASAVFAGARRAPLRRARRAVFLFNSLHIHAGEPRALGERPYGERGGRYFCSTRRTFTQEKRGRSESAPTIM